VNRKFFLAGLTAICAFVSSQSAFAQTEPETDNSSYWIGTLPKVTGTYAAVCPDATQPNGRKVYAHALFMAQSTMGANFKIDMGKGTQYLDFVRNVFSRVRKFDLAADKYLKWTESFEDERQLAARSTIKEISNATEILDPANGCYKIQLAAQRVRPRDFDKRFVIDNALWTDMDEHNKAAAVVDEFILREGVHRGHKGPNVTSHYTAVISMEAMNRFSLWDYVKLIHETEARHLLETIHNGTHLGSLHPLIIDGFPVYYFKGDQGGASFHKNGKLMRATLAAPVEWTISGQKVELAPEVLISLNEEGVLINGGLHKDTPIVIGGQSMTLAAYKQARRGTLPSIGFYSDGKLKYAGVVAPAILKDKWGNDIPIDGYRSVGFDEAGQIISVWPELNSKKKKER
jgi:hypothetical protein